MELTRTMPDSYLIQDQYVPSRRAHTGRCIASTRRANASEPGRRRLRRQKLASWCAPKSARPSFRPVHTEAGYTDTVPEPKRKKNGGPAAAAECPRICLVSSRRFPFVLVFLPRSTATQQNTNKLSLPARKKIYWT
jgi:hypothetical protein